MTQIYSDPSRENDPHALPDIETFFVPADAHALEPGWYWWACFPGCLPDGDPVGPFGNEEAAIGDAQAVHS
jgi:hypothetical protein